MEIEPRETSKVFVFRKAAAINRLVNKKLNIVEVDDKLQIVECRDTENQPTITRAENPFSLEGTVAYFEIEVLRTTEEDCINVGLTSKDSSHKQLLGKSLSSFGLLKGDIYLDKKKVFSSPTHQKLRAGDRIGVGIDCVARSFFVVKNEVIVHQEVEIPTGWNQFFPAVGLSNEHEKVQFFFEPSECRFQIQQYEEKIQNKLRREIVNGPVQSSAQIYSLVYDYLRFNNYHQTIALLDAKQVDFPRVPRFTHSPSLLQPQAASSRERVKDEEVKEPPKGRSRVMSEKLNEEELSLMEVRRKNT